jgi:hypothetical protein
METQVKNQVKVLLSKGDSNAKTAKNELKTFILYMSPFTQNSFGVNLCPKASKACPILCLATAGRMGMINAVSSRVRKADFFISDRKAFLTLLLKELQTISKSAVKGDYKVAIRLNGTTDLDFFGLMKAGLNFDLFTLPNLVFYDYTKILGKVVKYQSAIKSGKYVLTFSRSESNFEDCKKALAMGVNVAVVFGSDALKPHTFEGFPVLDGDKTDIEMLKVSGFILALRAKGKAKKDTSGFVVR